MEEKSLLRAEYAALRGGRTGVVRSRADLVGDVGRDVGRSWRRSRSCVPSTPPSGAGGRALCGPGRTWWEMWGEMWGGHGGEVAPACRVRRPPGREDGRCAVQGGPGGRCGERCGEVMEEKSLLRAEYAALRGGRTGVV